MVRNKFSTSTALALSFVLLSSSTAAVYAVASLPKHSVGEKQLKKFAVTNKKIAPRAVTGSKIASNTVVSASRMAFGRGNANTASAMTVLSLPRLHVTVTAGGESSTDPVVVVHLPSTAPAFSWVINSTWESQTFSSTGGAMTLGAQMPATTTTSREFTAHIWRSDTSAAIYLHCAFDTDGFTTAAPLSCTAFST
jgi:hypothetical protein